MGGRDYFGFILSNFPETLNYGLFNMRTPVASVNSYHIS